MKKTLRRRVLFVQGPKLTLGVRITYTRSSGRDKMPAQEINKFSKKLNLYILVIPFVDLKGDPPAQNRRSWAPGGQSRLIKTKSSNQKPNKQAPLGIKASSAQSDRSRKRL